MTVQDLWADYIDLPEDQKWRFIRAYRGELLSGCDWTQLADSPLTEEDKVAWAIYRQSLRDITDTFETADEVVFPVMI